MGLNKQSNSQHRDTDAEVPNALTAGHFLVRKPMTVVSSMGFERIAIATEGNNKLQRINDITFWP